MRTPICLANDTPRVIDFHRVSCIAHINYSIRLHVCVNDSGETTYTRMLLTMKNKISIMDVQYIRVITFKILYNSIYRYIFLLLKLILQRCFINTNLIFRMF